MNRFRKVFWGIMFIVGAMALLVIKLGYLEGIGFWSILFTLALIGVMVDGILSKGFGKILFSLAFLVIIYDEYLGVEAITPWPVLGAAFLGTIGLSILFPRVGWNGWKTEKLSDEDILDEDTISFANSFGDAVKYLSGQKISRVHVKNSFGDMNVYFDGAMLQNGTAEVYVDNFFGETILYIPRGWGVTNELRVSFGDAEEKGVRMPDGSGAIRVRGKVSFGNCDIRYL